MFHKVLLKRVGATYKSINSSAFTDLNKKEIARTKHFNTKVKFLY